MNDAVRLMVDIYESREPIGPPEKTAGAGSSSQRLTHQGSGSPYCYLRCGDLRLPGITEWHIGPLGLPHDDDADDMDEG